MHRTPRFWVLYHSESVHACFDYQAHLACMLCFISSSLLYKCCSVKASLSVRIRRSKRLLLSLIPGLTFIFPSYHTPKTSGISSRIDSVCKSYIFWLILPLLWCHLPGFFKWLPTSTWRRKVRVRVHDSYEQVNTP